LDPCSAQAANVLLSSPDLSQAVPKVCDFGVATIVQTSMASGMSAGASGSAGKGSSLRCIGRLLSDGCLADT
jgi:hypothetical protein